MDIHEPPGDFASRLLTNQRVFVFGIQMMKYSGSIHGGVLQVLPESERMLFKTGGNYNHWACPAQRAFMLFMLR